jgi:hypothetical protein
MADYKAVRWVVVAAAVAATLVVALFAAWSVVRIWTNDPAVVLPIITTVALALASVTTAAGAMWAQRVSKPAQQVSGLDAEPKSSGQQPTTVQNVIGNTITSHGGSAFGAYTSQEPRGSWSRDMPNDE